MKPLTFVHCADLHIDSPYTGISEIEPDLGQLLYESPYQSFSKIVDLAIDRNVDAVLIAGDIYDSADRSLQAQLKFRNSVTRLSEAGIPTFVVHGNHDPLNSWSSTLEWPEDVFIFPGEEVRCVPLSKNGEVIALVYGISFPERDVYDNLVLRFEPENKAVPCIGLLHANLGSDTGHKPYAPCTTEDLVAKGIDYWALGHIHSHAIMRATEPTIVYPGCSQSRNPRETGPKGCCLVTLEPRTNPRVEFIPTDVVRHESASIDISGCLNLDQVISCVKQKCEEVSLNMDKRHAIIRLSLTGRTEVHRELLKGNTTAELLEHVREYYAGSEPRIWLEKLILKTSGMYDLESLREGHDFIADIISVFDELEDTNSEHWEELQGALSVLFSNRQVQKYLEELPREELLEIAREARGRTLDMLVRPSQDENM